MMYSLVTIITIFLSGLGFMVTKASGGNTARKSFSECNIVSNNRNLEGA